MDQTSSEISISFVWPEHSTSDCTIGCFDISSKTVILSKEEFERRSSCVQSSITRRYRGMLFILLVIFNDV